MKTKKEAYSAEFNKIFLDVLQQPGFAAIRIKNVDGFLRMVEERGEASFYMVALETIESCKMAYRTARERMDMEGMAVEQSAITTLVDLTKQHLSLLQYLLMTHAQIDALPETDRQQAAFVLNGQALVIDLAPAHAYKTGKPSKTAQQHSRNITGWDGISGTMLQ